MEYKKHDMYRQAGQIEKNGWMQTAPPAKKEKELKTEVELDVKKEMKVQVEMEVPEIVVRKKEVVGVMPEMPVVNGAGCGYCVTPGMAYVPMTQWSQPYEPELGFERGTIFPELDYPFVGKGACDHE